jgi:hypothetical protein
MADSSTYLENVWLHLMKKRDLGHEIRIVTNNCYDPTSWLECLDGISNTSDIALGPYDLVY